MLRSWADAVNLDERGALASEVRAAITDLLTELSPAAAARLRRRPPADVPWPQDIRNLTGKFTWRATMALSGAALRRALSCCRRRLFRKNSALLALCCIITGPKLSK
jgi:hypothetical protein